MLVYQFHKYKHYQISSGVRASLHFALFSKKKIPHKKGYLSHLENSVTVLQQNRLKCHL